MTKALLFRYDDAFSEQKLADVLEACEEIAVNDLGLSVFPNQITIVSDTGMCDAYANHGMPYMYAHWSFGKKWKQMEHDMKNGRLGLAYETVVPTNPCISWNLSSNGMAMMAVVIAHAAFGHNHVFKNNYLFKKWTHHATLADYCLNARDAITAFEKQYGEKAVEEILDAAHALVLPGGVFRESEPQPFNLEEEKRRLAKRMRFVESSVDSEMLATVPGLFDRMAKVPDMPKEKPEFPQENLLYFIERYSPRLALWEREVTRIVRTLAQQTSFPQIQTRVLNEGAAMFVEYYIMRKLYEQGRLDEGTMMDMAYTNPGVLYQQEFRRTGKLSPRYNPYALGLAICKDVVRICGMNEEDTAFFHGWLDTTGPTDEDRQWFKFAGNNDWRATLRDAWANYRDSSFIEQFLSPRVMREWQMFTIRDEGDDYVVTDTIHERTPEATGYSSIRHQLGQAHSYDAYLPDISVVGADMLDERTLKLKYTSRQLMELDEDNRTSVLEYAKRLWGYDVEMEQEYPDDE